MTAVFDKLGVGASGLEGASPDRIGPDKAAPLFVAALALGLAACATSVAPVVYGARPGPPPSPGAAYPGSGPRFVSWPASECVPFARSASGIEIYGNANTWWSQAAGRYRRGDRPEPGSVMVMRTNGVGHVAVVRRVVSPRVILVDHANWHGRGELAVHVPVRDVSEDNSWSEVNVWWLDTNQWGAKSYRIEGFIEAR